MSEPELQEKTGRNPDGTFKEGVSGNPNGRPKRKTFRDYFTDVDEAELMERVKQAMSEKEIMKMIVEQLFGKPRQNIGLDGGEENKPISILNYVSGDNSNKENNKPEEED
jgi:hypothetical protein